MNIFLGFQVGIINITLWIWKRLLKLRSRKHRGRRKWEYNQNRYNEAELVPLNSEQELDPRQPPYITTIHPPAKR